VDAPAFQELEDLAADVAAARASWGRYAEFLRERDELAHRDWLSMRDQVGGSQPGGSRF
jgi:dynein heavy chain 2